MKISVDPRERDLATSFTRIFQIVAINSPSVFFFFFFFRHTKTFDEKKTKNMKFNVRILLRTVSLKVYILRFTLTPCWIHYGIS